MRSSFSIEKLTRELSPKKSYPDRVKRRPVEEPDPKLVAKKNTDSQELAEREIKPSMPIEEFLQKLELDTASDEDDLISLENEKLPGSCKSQYAMKFKLDSDSSI